MAGECILPGLAAKLHDGAGLVFSEHGVYLREVYLREATDDGSLFLKLLKIGFALRTSEMAHAVSDQISTCCDYNQRWKYGNWPSRVQTIHYGLDATAANGAQPPSARRPVITWLGRFDPLKDIETLLRAASIVHRQRPDAVFRLYGSATPDAAAYYTQMLALRRELGLDQAVELPGYTSDPQRAYGDADIVVLTSISEGFPYATLEAMACGRPVVATAVGGLPEQLGGCGVLVQPQSPELLAAALLDLIDDPAARARLGAAARERVRTTFSLEQKNRLHLDAYLAAVANADVPVPSTPPDAGPAHAVAASGVAASDPLLGAISAEVPHPVDHREIAAVLEAKGVTDAGARTRYGARDTFALAAAILANLSRASDAAPPRPHRMDPPVRERRRIPRAIDGVLLLVPAAVLVSVSLWASSIAGWTSGIGQALLVGVAASALLGNGFRFAIMRRGALLIGCARWSATRRFLSRWSWLALSSLLLADLVAVIAAGAVWHLSGAEMATVGSSFAALIGFWILSNGLVLAQRAHEVGLATLAGVVVAVAAYSASGAGSTLHVEIAVAAGYLATMTTIASRVIELLGHGGGERATPRLPRLPYLLREAVPFGSYGSVLIVLVLAPNLLTALHAISGASPEWRSIAVGMTLALAPSILAIPIAEGALYGLSQSVATVFSEATVPQTKNRVGELLYVFHRRQSRRYAVRLALLSLIAVPLIWLLAGHGRAGRAGGRLDRRSAGGVRDQRARLSAPRRGTARPDGRDHIWPPGSRRPVLARRGRGDAGCWERRVRGGVRAGRSGVTDRRQLGDGAARGEGVEPVLCARHSSPRRCDVTAVLRLGLPAYGYPGTGVWEHLSALQAGALVIMDPADGPGRSIDPRYSAAVSTATRHGLCVLGYVTTDYGRRSAAEMKEEVERYREWYGVSGIFLDQAPASISSSAAIAHAVSHIRASGLTLAINPGQPDIDPHDAAIADHVVNFEGPHSSYRRCRFPDWVRDVASTKFWHLIYEVRDARTMREVAAMASRAHAGVVYITDATMPNPWERLPEYWLQEQALFTHPRRAS